MENFIDSKTSLEYWKSLKPVKSYRQKRFFLDVIDVDAIEV